METITKKPVRAKKSLAEANPDVAAEWHPTLNGSLTPQEVTSGSNKKAYWLGKDCGHTWEASIHSRANRGNGCSVCAGRVVLAGYNDLGTINSNVAAEWHPVLNGSLTPQEATAGSGKKVFWLGKDCGHTWKAAIYSRSRGKGNGCSVCAGRVVLAGYNDLGTINSNVAAEWHPKLNGSLTPQEVTAGSEKKVFWLGEDCGHTWEARIDHRANSGSGCSVCTGKTVLAGYNDLGTINSDVAAEWHPKLNGSLTPQEVTTGSGKKAFWLGKDCGHTWEARIDSRAAKGYGCSVCTGKTVLAGYNDLVTKEPEVAAEWHPALNGPLTPQEVTTGSGKKAFWLGKDCGHTWEVRIASRTSGYGCPVCASQTILVGYNDLAFKNPDVAAEWHPILNGSLTPQEVFPGSDRKAYWLGKNCGHTWEANIYSRANNGNGCSVCPVGKTEIAFRDQFTQLSGHDFVSARIALSRLSRKAGMAQVDMLNDEIKVAIEYDGAYTHGGEGITKKDFGTNALEAKLAQDKETSQALVDAGYKVIRIREHSKIEKLPFVPLDSGYEDNVFQIIYLSYTAKKDNIADIVATVLNERQEWFG